MQFVVDFFDHLKDTGDKLILLIVAVAYAISNIRQNRAVTDTGQRVEEAKQKSAQVYTDQLEAVISRADLAATAAEKREGDLRRINDALREQFTGSLNEFRAMLAARDERIGYLLEEVAEWRGKSEAFHAEKLDLQAAIQRQRTDGNEEKRAVTAGYERELASLRLEMSGLTDRNHDLVNQIYGAGTATNIMGPKE